MGEVKFMDCLYRAYSSPMDLMSRYINQGRFGTFVEGFIKAEYERKKAENERENEWMLWTAYVHSYSEKSFDGWKEEVLGTKPTARKGIDHELTDEGVNNILHGLFPSHTSPGK